MELIVLLLLLFVGLPAFLFVLWIFIVCWAFIKRIDDIKQGKVDPWDTNES
jgi:hypothetical protein